MEAGRHLREVAGDARDGVALAAGILALARPGLHADARVGAAAGGAAGHRAGRRGPAAGAVGQRGRGAQARRPAQQRAARAPADVGNIL